MQMTVLLSSVTYAMQAKHVLYGIGIKAKVTKITSSNMKGCTYALRIDDSVYLSAIAALRANGIPYELSPDHLS